MSKMIIDGFGLAYRSHFAFSNLTTEEGLPSGCIYGFLTALRGLKKKFPASHVIIAWDCEAKRKKNIYADYKANRTPFRVDTPIDTLKEIFSCLNVTQAQMEGEEADDVIASLAKYYSDQDELVYIYTSDKDMMQLVQDGKVIVIRPKSGGRPEKVFDEEAVKNEYGVKPSKIASYLAFRGDTSDNIPGVPRLPSKVISVLLSKYEDPASVYANLKSEKLTKNQLEKMIQFEQQIYLNHKLTKLCPNLEYTHWVGTTNKDRLKSILGKYEIKAINVDSFSVIFEEESSFLDRRSQSFENYSLF